MSRRLARPIVRIACVLATLLAYAPVFAQQSGSDPGETTRHAAHAQHPPAAVAGQGTASAVHSARALTTGHMIGERPVDPGLGAASGQARMDMSGMQGGRAPADARDPDYSDGHAHGPMTGMDMQDDAALGMLLIDRLEYFNGRDGNGTAFEGQAWYGTDLDRLRIRFEGEYGGGDLEDLRSEVLWDHAVAAHWNTQLGVRHDDGVGPGRDWIAFGVHGLAPYWFEIDATAYVGLSGRSALRVETGYELRLTQRLIVQPRFEANLYGRDDAARGIGAGLSDAALGIRLRYELRREFAPYVGVEWSRRFGRTADYARAEGQPVYDPQLIAGLRFWF